MITRDRVHVSSPLLPHHAQPRRVERQGALALGGEEGLDSLVTPGQHLPSSRGHLQPGGGRQLTWTGTASSLMLARPTVLPYTSSTAQQPPAAAGAGRPVRWRPACWLFTNSRRSRLPRSPGQRQKESRAPGLARLSLTGLAQYPSLAMRSGQAYLGAAAVLL